MKKMLIALGAVAAIAGPAATASANPSFGGVVVGTQGRSVLVASSTGLVRAFAGHAPIGARVVLVGGRLTVDGRSRSAHVRGIVVRRIGSTMFLSSNRHLVAVHSGRVPASAGHHIAPPPGDEVSTQVTISGNQLDADSEDDLGPAANNTVHVQAVVTAVGNGTVTVSVNGQSLTLPLPAGLTLPASFVGQTVDLNVSLGSAAAATGNGDDQGENGQGDGEDGNGGGTNNGGGDGGGDS
jgi:hypothetical protein